MIRLGNLHVDDKKKNYQWWLIDPYTRQILLKTVEKTIAENIPPLVISFFPPFFPSHNLIGIIISVSTGC